MKRRELETHLQDLFDGCIDPEAFYMLQEELRDNPEARVTYREYLHLHHALRFHAKGGNLLPVVPMDLVVERRQRRSMKQAGLAAVALLVLGALIMGLILSSPKEATLTFTTSPGTDLVVSHEINGDNLPEGQALEPGSQLILGHGAVELEFASGVRAILRGPAELILLREDLLDLAYGTAWFHVPQKAVGFQVRTPDLVLTDLGTEFGILSQPDSLAEVHVFTGSVEVLNRHGLKHKQVIEADHARVAGPAGRWQGTAPRSDHFLTKLPDRVPVNIEADDSVAFTTSPENKMINKGRYTFKSSDELSGFDASGSDKLVATLSHEKSTITEVTYGGVRMSLGVCSNTSAMRQTAIYYLDSPGTTGDLVVVFKGRQRAPNGVGGSLLALSNTANGGPAVIAQSGERSVRLTTKVDNSFVVAAHISNDQQPNAFLTARAPLTPLFGAPVGSATGGSGYMHVKSHSSVMPAFSGNGTAAITVAAAFDPHP
ncbi:MAG: FecR family protein [Verrucomicrobiae bacterium]|nr:FecR family protein [Verrucomicrobiae bacterium]NNJ44255.1 FecR domain-containing protein [Akkermansiaceae bacterium]